MTTGNTNKLVHMSIVGRRWYDSTGNTYHTAVISLTFSNGERLRHKTPLTYGYGEQYVETAKVWLAENGFPIPDRESIWSWFRDKQGIALDYFSVDVKRKRDL